MEKENFQIGHMRSLDAKGLAALESELRSSLMALRMDMYKEKKLIFKESRGLKKALARLLTVASEKRK